MRITKAEAALLSYGLEAILYKLPDIVAKHSDTKADRNQIVRVTQHFIDKLDAYSLDNRRGRRGVLNDFSKRFRKQFMPTYLTNEDKAIHAEQKELEAEKRKEYGE